MDTLFPIYLFVSLPHEYLQTLFSFSLKSALILASNQDYE